MDNEIRDSEIAGDCDENQVGKVAPKIPELNFTNKINKLKDVEESRINQFNLFCCTNF